MEIYFVWPLYFMRGQDAMRLRIFIPETPNTMKFISKIDIGEYIAQGKY